MSEKPRRTRPTIQPRENEPSMLGLLAPPDLKRKMIGASEVNGRSLSQEGVARLSTTFLAQDIFGQGAQLFWNGNADLVFLIGEIANKFAPKAEWQTDDANRDLVSKAIRRAFVCLFDPEAALQGYDPDPPKWARIDDYDKRADFFLAELGADTPWARAKRERLGDLGARLVAWHDAAHTRFSSTAEPPPASAAAEEMWTKAFDQAAERHNAEAREGGEGEDREK